MNILTKRAADSPSPAVNVFRDGWTIEAPVDAKPSIVLAKLLDEIDTGIIVCDPAGAIQTANSAARYELASGRLLGMHGTTLIATEGDCGLAAAIGAVCKLGRRQILELRCGSERMYVSVSPLQVEGDLSWALLLLGRREPCSLLGLELLGIQQGLTLAERRVLAGLAAERNPAEIAREHGVAISTIRSQIGSLRAKLDVRTHQALLCRISGLPPLAPALRLGFGGNPTSQQKPAAVA